MSCKEPQCSSSPYFATSLNFFYCYTVTTLGHVAFFTRGTFKFTYALVTYVIVSIANTANLCLSASFFWYDHIYNICNISWVGLHLLVLRGCKCCTEFDRLKVTRTVIVLVFSWFNEPDLNFKTDTWIFILKGPFQIHH